MALINVEYRLIMGVKDKGDIYVGPHKECRRCRNEAGKYFQARIPGEKK